VGAIREAMTTSSMVEMLRQQVQRSKDRVRDKEHRCGLKPCTQHACRQGGRV
jgi:hypothetical protein